MEDTTIEIPEKLFYKASEVCQYTDTQPYVLRFWESEFPQLASEKNRSGQRVYRRSDIDLVFRIKKLLYEEEYTIAGARKAIDENKTTAIIPPGPPKARGKRAAPNAHPDPEAPAEHAAPESQAPLFGETRPEMQEAPPSPVAAAAAEEETRYRALYEETLASLNELRERNRRLAAHLEASIQ